MSKIKYAVVGIDPRALSGLIGTLAIGEIDGPGDIVVLPAPLPVVFSVDENTSTSRYKEVPFGSFLAYAVGKERRRLTETSPGPKLIDNVVDLLTTKQAQAQEQEKG